MVHLIVVIMGIALMSYLLVSGISYMNPSSFESKEKFERWSVTNLNLSVAWSRCYEIKGHEPSSVTELQSMLSVTAPIPDDLILTEITGHFPGWCFEGSVSKGGYESLKSLALRYPDQYGLGDTCGVTGGLSASWSTPASNSDYPLPITVTYRFSR